MTKQEFIKLVFHKITFKGARVSDAILDCAIHGDIDVEVAARMVSSNSELKKLLEEEAISLNALKVNKT